MRFRAIEIVTLLALLSSAAAATDGGSTRFREFPDYRCRLALPGPQFQWRDHSQVPNAQAMLGDEAGTILILQIHQAPSGFVLDDTFIRGFDEGFVRPGQVTKIDGAMTTFLDLPCYEVHARMEEPRLIMTSRCFAANGFIYSLQMLSNEIPTPGRPLAQVFSAFQFVGTPVPPQPRSAEDRQAYNTGHLIGRLTFYLIVAVVVISIVKRVLRQKPPAAPGAPTACDTQDQSGTSGQAR